MAKDTGRVVFNATRIHVPSDVLTTFKTAEVTQETKGFIDAAKLYEQMKELRAMQTGAAETNILEQEAKGPSPIAVANVSSSDVQRS